MTLCLNFGKIYRFRNSKLDFSDSKGNLIEKEYPVLAMLDSPPFPSVTVGAGKARQSNNIVDHGDSKNIEVEK